MLLLVRPNDRPLLFCMTILVAMTLSELAAAENRLPTASTMFLSDESSPDFTGSRIALRPNDPRERTLPANDTKFENGLLFPAAAGFENHSFHASPGLSGMSRRYDDSLLQTPQTEKTPGHDAHPGVNAPSAAAAALPSYSFDSREWAEHFPVGPEVHAGPWSDPRFATLFERPPPDRHRPGATGPIAVKPVYAKHLKHARLYGVVQVLANFPLTEIEPILGEIALLQTDLHRYMGVPSPNETIELCLFKDEKSYLAFLKDVFPKAPRDRRALYIKMDNQPGTLLVQRSKEFEIDLRHEMTHAIIHASIPVVPIWLDEGLAKYFEVPPDERSAKNPYMKPVRRNTRFGAVPSLKRLERLEHIGQMGVREYRDSWAWVHFLVHHSQDTHRLLAGYLQLLATLPKPESSSGERPIPALSPYLDDRMERVRDKYREHFRTWGVAD